MAHLQLAPGVSFAMLGEGSAIFLDLRRDRYFALGEAAARTLALACTNPEFEVDDDAAAGLLDTGLFAAAPGRNHLVPVSMRPVERELFSETVTKITASELLEIWRILARVRRALRSRPIVRVIEHCRDVGRQANGHPSANETEALASGFTRTRSWVPIKPSCLQDSLALHEWLSRRGASAALVLGVKCDPFAAHSWLQLGETVLNDRLETVRAFTPILAIECA